MSSVNVYSPPKTAPDGDQYRAHLNLYTVDHLRYVEVYATGGGQINLNDPSHVNGYYGSTIDLCGKVVRPDDTHDSRCGASSPSTGQWNDSSWYWSNVKIGDFYKQYNTEQTVTRTVTFNWGGYGEVSVSASVTIDAIYRYNVTYHKNTSDTVTKMPANGYKYKDESYTVQPPMPEREGYTFLGWATSADGLPSYRSLENIPANVNQDIDLYAVWDLDVNTLEYIGDTYLDEFLEGVDFTWEIRVPTNKYTLKLELGEWSYTSENITPTETGGQIARYITESVILQSTDVETLMGLLPDVDTGIIKATLTAYDSSDNVDDTSVRYFNGIVPLDVIPSATVSVASDTRTGAWKKGLSRAVVTVSNISAGAGSYLTEVKIYANGEEVSQAIEDEQATVDSVVLTSKTPWNSSGSKTIGIRVIDARGRIYETSVSVTIADYTKPTISVTCGYSAQEVRFVVAAAKDSNSLSPVITVTRYDMDGNGSVIKTITSGGSSNQYSHNDTDLPSGFGKKNFKYVWNLDDGYDTAEAIVYPRGPYCGDRFDELTGDEYYLNMDYQGWEDLRSNYTCEVGEDSIIIDRMTGATTAGVGFPIAMASEQAYEIVYGCNDMNGIYVDVSFFDENTVYLGHTEHLDPQDVFTTPEGTAWGIVRFAVVNEEGDYSEAGAGHREFFAVSIRTYAPKSNEDIEWFVETGYLGLNTPNQKYISRIQTRIAYSGTLKAYISYDNSDTFTEVHSSSSDHMRNITIPINVRRCDRFRIRLEGVGRVEMYSFGYDVDEGSGRCLI